jgi:trehalose 6-phosphate synthase/phosphatase
MAEQRRVISALFCLPNNISYNSGEWNSQTRRGTSALFDALSYLSSRGPHTILGWTGEITSPSAAGDGIHVPREDRKKLEKQLADSGNAKVAPVWLWDDVDAQGDVAHFKNQRRWRQYAEHELYTLFHYKQHEPTDGRAERLWWADFFKMNQLFADRILEIYKPGDIIWIHDYHLILLPNILRQRLPSADIGYYLHIPFPSSEFLRCLARRKEILQGALGANLIGFQSLGYCRHFVSCCKRILHFESSHSGVDAYGAHVAVEAFPIGIDALTIKKAAFETPSVDEKAKGIMEMYAGKRIIVGRDRLDTVRGVAQKLQAFEIFLDRYPEWTEKVVLIQVTSPTSIEEEKEDGDHKISNKISDLVARINGKHGSLSFSPVQHYPQYISRDEYLALLRVANVGLITSVRDGMNTTSLEYVVCQEGNYGPLILSEFSGTAGNLTSAMHINPWDLYGVAETLNEALKMSPESRKEQHGKLYARVTSNTVQAWTDGFLEKLESTIHSTGNSNVTPVLDKTALLAQYRKANQRLFMFDYDGTLTPIVKDPLAAIPSDKVIRTLKTLAADPRNAVWIISGRDQAFLDEWMGHIPELGLSAEHGSFIRHPHEDIWENITEKEDMSWQKEVIEVFQDFTEKTQGSFIEKKKVAVTWHYRRADPEFGAYQARQCQKKLQQTVATKYDVEVMEGKANVEVRPTFVNKGEIAKRLVREYGEPPRTPLTSKPSESTKAPTDGTSETFTPSIPDFVYCLGDDFTDEDMFRALNGISDLSRETVFTCTVGASSKQTLASWHLLEPADVISTLGLLNGTSIDEQDLGTVAIVDGATPEGRRASVAAAQ